MHPIDKSSMSFEHYYLQEKIDKEYEDALEARKSDSQDFIRSCETQQKNFSCEDLKGDVHSNMPPLNREENK